MARERRATKFEGAFIPGAEGEGELSEGLMLELAQNALSRGQLQEASAILAKLQAQVAGGYHKNPALVMYGNPPTHGGMRYVGKLGRIDSFRYRHETEGPREHKFEDPSTVIWCATKHDRHIFTIENENGLPIWEDS